MAFPARDILEVTPMDSQPSCSVPLGKRGARSGCLVELLPVPSVSSSIARHFGPRKRGGMATGGEVVGRRCSEHKMCLQTTEGSLR
eukprot:1642426-Prorocentrum_lima.AAC.1